MSIIHEYFNDDNTNFKWVVELSNNICGKRIFVNNMPSDYIITKDAEVYHILNNEKIPQKISNKGYLFVYLPSSMLSYSNNFYVHRLVALGYVINVNNKPIINHIDGCKTNNSISNLEWCTYSENNLHAFRTGLKKPTKPAIGEASNLCLHTEDEVRMVCELFEQGYDPEGVHVEFGISKAFASKIYYRKSWMHISKDYNFDKGVLYNKFFDRDTTEEIFDLYRVCMRTKDIMEYLHIPKNETNRSHVRLVIRRIKKYDKKMKKHHGDLYKPL